MTDQTILDTLVRPRLGVFARIARRLKAYGILRRRRWTQSTGFTSAFVGLAAKMAAADGVAVSSEAAVFEQFLDVPPGDVDRIKSVYAQAAADVTGYEVYADRVGELGHQRTNWATTATGFTLGVLVAISSVGAGALGVTALLLLYPRLPMVRIVGSDIAHAVPLTLVAGIGHWFIGSLDWLLLASLLIGSIPGIIVGSFIASRVSETILRTLLSIILAVVATRLVFA